MLKEIHEQPEKAQALINFLKEPGQMDEFCSELKDESRIYLIGSGSSYNACVLGAYYLSKIAGIEAVPVVAGAFKEVLGQVDLSQGAYILISQSGETKDVVSVLNFLEEKKAKKILALVNVLGSSLQLRVKNYLPLLSNIEISVPATKTFTNQVIILFYLALILGKRKGKHNIALEEDFGTLPFLIKETLSQTSEKCKEIARFLAKKEYLYYLGYGINFGVCLEAALKMKEITYIPCEGIYSSEFKHGPLAIIKKGDWVFFLSTLEDVYMTLSHINEVSCRFGKICTIAPLDDSLSLNSNELITLPSQNYFFVPLLGNIVAQQLAYYVSQEKGINPDQPRNISKTLTVD
jgi:glucosamine--fructose-6-phosphate aminotransferase (isomerizing)